MTRWAIVLAWFGINQARESSYFLNYGNMTKNFGQIKEYDYVVLEPDHSPPPSDKGKAKWIAYLSLGEIHESRYYFQKFAESALPENPDWPKARRMDPRNKIWRQYVSDTLVPHLRQLGWDGLFFDTGDVGPWLETQDSVKFKGAKNAMVDFVKEIRSAWPEGYLVLNNGYEFVIDVAPVIDAQFLEGLHTRWDFTGKKYILSDPTEKNMRIQRALAAKEISNQLDTWVLDYSEKKNDKIWKFAKKSNLKFEWKQVISNLELTRWP